MVAQAEVAELLGLVGLVVAEAVTVTVAIAVGMAVVMVGLWWSWLMRPLGWLALLGWHLGVDWLKDILSLQTVTVLESIIGHPKHFPLSRS